MYEKLSTRELTVFQDMLYSATGKAFRLANLSSSDPDRLTRYRQLHSDVARLFLEAAEELVGRLDHAVQAPAA